MALLVLGSRERRALAGIGVAVHPMLSSSSTVPGIEVNVPSPTQAVPSMTAARHQATLLLLVHGPLANAFRARVRNHITKLSHRSKPITPCSERIRVYSFSIPIGFFTCPSRK